jgi:aryl-alcohol dehydrogenase-like predicted oxidoreductase
VLGRTGLKVSVMGLGAGGASRLGLGTGKTPEEAVRVVRRALELGVNIIDTAEAYGNEDTVGRALKGVPRSEVVVSTKKTSSAGDRPITPRELSEGLDASLRRLGLDYVDIYHLHGVAPSRYAQARDELYPEMTRLKAAGKLRFIGITEAFESDRGHATLVPAATDGVWDVMMVGFNILNQSARERVIAPAARSGAGILCMFAVRRAFSDPARLKDVLADLSARGRLRASLLGRGSGLDFLEREEGGGMAAGNLVAAAYRFCRFEPGIHCVLSGTGTVEHLEANARALDAPPLSPPVTARLKELFAGVDDVSGG